MEGDLGGGGGGGGTQERANKLVLAFGDRWQSECFTKSVWAW